VRVTRGPRAGHGERAGGRQHTVGGVYVVFNENGDAVQRPADAARPALAVERVGDGERVGVRLDDRPQGGAAAVHVLYAFEILLGDLAGRQPTRPHRLLEARGGRLVQLEGAGLWRGGREKVGAREGRRRDDGE
jgi:hypothetical protein